MRDTDATQGGALWAAETVWYTINASSLGANTVISAVAGKYHLAMSYVLVCAADNVVTFQDSDGTVLSGPMSLSATGGISAPRCAEGHFKVPVGKGLVINLGTAAQVGGHITLARV